MKLNVIVTSTRPGRVGEAIGRWFFDHASAARSGFEVVLTDLAEVGLPVYDEPRHPMLRDYRHDHTKRWSQIVDASDSFVFVLPEYNFTAPPSFFNAVDYLHSEWQYKPAGFVSYGGISGGLRSTQTAKTMLTGLKVMPIPEQVIVPMVSERVKDGEFMPTDIVAESADKMIAELARWARALAPLRQDAA